MKRSPKFSVLTKWIFYVVFVALLFTGVAWIFWQNPLLMRFHGAAAMVSLVIFGWMIPAHIQLGLQKQKRVYSGFILVGVMVLFALSGYGLYYFSNETLRAVTIFLHRALGIGSPVLLIFHLLRPKK